MSNSYKELIKFIIPWDWGNIAALRVLNELKRVRRPRKPHSRAGKFSEPLQGDRDRHGCWVGSGGRDGFARVKCHRREQFVGW